jgi:TolA-binding protein
VFALGGAFALGVAVGASGLSPDVQRADAELALQAEPRAVVEGSIFRGATGALGTPQAARLASDRTTKAQRARASDAPETHELVPAPQNLIEPTAPVPVTPLWQLAAQQGEYQTALGELEASGGFDAVAAQADADQLMYLADVARATGFKQRAVMAWRRVISQHASDPQASLAAWSLGNMLEQSGDQLGAAEAFAAYRGLSPQGDFAEDALVREIRMAAAQQNAQLANRLAAQYDQAFPNGRRAQEIQEQLAKLQRGATVSADAGAPEVESAAPQK